MTPSTKQLCDSVLKLDAETAPGPWIATDGGIKATTSTGTPLIIHDSAILESYGPSQLIAHYRTAAPELARRLLKMEALAEKCLTYFSHEQDCLCELCRDIEDQLKEALESKDP